MVLSPAFVHTILATSLTGATLILALYAIVIPYSKHLLIRRAELLIGADQYYSRNVVRALLSQSKKQTKKVDESFEDKKEYEKLPSYFSRKKVILVFAGYLISTLMALAWSANPTRALFDGALPWVFGIVTVVFLAIGWNMIMDIDAHLEKHYKKVIWMIKKGKSSRRKRVKSIGNPSVV